MNVCAYIYTHLYSESVITRVSLTLIDHNVTGE